MARVARLDDAEIKRRIDALDGWELRDGKLHREFRFADFSAAFAFMTTLALYAEKADHHPEWFNVYNRVVIDLATHDVDGISELDFAFAARADAAFG